MTGSLIYQIIPSEFFEQSYRSLIDRHYRKRSDKRAFAAAVAQLVGTIASQPELHPLEPCPASLPEGLSFRKARLWMPRLSGDARWGRLMYLVRESAAEVRLLWIYTHAEFASRPSDEQIDVALKALLASIFAGDGSIPGGGS